MRIRTQLILAAFVLAVIPLAAIVTYSYHSSRRALESAYRREADQLTRQMDRRLASIRVDLDRRLQFVSALPLPNDAGGATDVGSIVTAMGETASLVDALDFEPLRGGVPMPAEAPDVDVEIDTDDGDENRDAPEPPVPPMPPAAPMVIELPPLPEIPRFVMSEEQQEILGEIGALGATLANTKLSPEERQDAREEMQAAQEELRRVVAADREQFHTQMRQAQQARRDRDREIARLRRDRDVRIAPDGRTAVVAPRTAVTPPVDDAPQSTAAKPKTSAKKTKNAVKVKVATAKDLKHAADSAKKTSLILGRSFQAPVRQQGEVVGSLSARISPEELVRRILGSATEDGRELPFAVDREGTLYTRNAEERARLGQLGIVARVKKGRSLKGIEGWIVSSSVDPQSGLRIGVARPVGDNLDELRNAAARNFALGVGLIAFALIGIVPLSNHLTRDVTIVTAGAERIAQGDLMTRLPVKTNNELGQLAKAFNQMAEDLSVQQQMLLEQERARKEQELQQRLMAVEYERKSIELEEARRFQLSMLPKEVPQHREYDVAVFTRTATEVGGDYYDFHSAGEVLTVTIGDATGHGAKAGTMVTVVKTLFAGYDAATAPAAFLLDAAEKIKRMDLGRMAMALSVGRFDGRELTVSSAGMPPVLVHRVATGAVEEIVLNATPLGTYGEDYPQADVKLERGDTVLLLTDGFPELMNDAGQQLGYAGALDAFGAAARAESAQGVIAALSDTARRWHGDTPPHDDVTFVVVRIA
jgi:serine phosphatase RsbU (regulator of sigma subunit)